MKKSTRGEDRPSRKFVVEDLLDFRIISDIDLAPDGTSVAYVVEEIDAKADATYSNVHLVAGSDGSSRPLTFGKSTNASPRFSPDGVSLAFVSDRGGTPQLYVLRLDGGEARCITSLVAGAARAEWSPDGTQLVFAAAIAVEGPPHAPRVTRRASYKTDGAGFIANTPMQVFVVPATGGDARQITHGEGSAMEPHWSPDGQRIVFTRMRSGRLDAHRSDVWVLPVDGGEPRQLTTNVAHTSAPVFSPDGRTVVFLGSRREGDARRQLWVVGADGGDERIVGSEDDELASYPLYRAPPPILVRDGADAIVVEAASGRSRVSRVRLSDGRKSAIVEGDRQVALAAAAGEHVAFLWSDVRMCGRLSIARLDGSEERLLVSLNEQWADRRDWPRIELRDQPSGRQDDAPRTSCLLVHPGGNGPFPLLVDVHGGPASFVELGYPYHPYWYVLASRGWMIMSLNAVGSGSYGKERSDCLRGHWGEMDLPEHLDAIDRLVEQGLVDPERVAIAGKSYGGYLAAWAIGNSSRFRAAVVSAAVTNLESHFGTSDSGYYVDPFSIGGEIFSRRDRYRSLSPVQHANKVTASTLILQGEDDQRCPIGQAEELFAALCRADKADVELVRYPGGSHSLQEKGRPSHRVDYHARVVDWLERHCARTA